MSRPRYYSAEWVEPISTTYRGWKVYELPPNGQGIAALQMLNIIEIFPLAKYAARSSRRAAHTDRGAEAGLSDLRRYLADPRFAKIPLEGMFSKEYARERAKLIDPERRAAMSSPAIRRRPRRHDLSSAVDREGNIVSLIQSDY